MQSGLLPRLHCVSFATLDAVSRGEANDLGTQSCIQGQLARISRADRKSSRMKGRAASTTKKRHLSHSVMEQITHCAHCDTAALVNTRYGVHERFKRSKRQLNGGPFVKLV